MQDASRWALPVLGLSLLLLAYNNLVGGFVPPPWYVPVHVAGAVLVVAAARRLGLTWPELGAAEWRRGLRWGLAVVGVVAGGLAVAIAVPAWRPLFEDDRVAGASGVVVAYRALVRIPFGTALLEEVAFRGVLLAAWSRWQGRVAAVAGSSLVFGLWHIRPTLELLDVNDVTSGGLAVAAAVLAAVVLTTAAGALFAWLRLRTGSLMAPLVAHAGINSAALLAAWLVVR